MFADYVVDVIIMVVGGLNLRPGEFIFLTRLLVCNDLVLLLPLHGLLTEGHICALEFAVLLLGEQFYLLLHFGLHFLVAECLAFIKLVVPHR